MNSCLAGRFADTRNDDDLSGSRDPLYCRVDPQDKAVGWDDEYGRSMKPSYLALNQLGNHGTLLILNTENRHLWVIAEQTGSSDPGLRHVAGMKSVNQNPLD
jgi:hypothetical protein